MTLVQRWDDDMMDAAYEFWQAFFRGDQDIFDRWLVYGIEQGFCGPAVCTTHDGIPSTREEDDVWEEYGEVCIHMMRPYTDAAQKEAVEENHSPSNWRKPR